MQPIYLTLPGNVQGKLLGSGSQAATQSAHEDILENECEFFKRTIWKVKYESQCAEMYSIIN